MKIFIDAGHGGKDSGAVGVNGRMEKDDNLKMANALKSEMEYRGHTVKMSRTGDAYPTLNERADAANVWGADVYVSLHRNSAGEDANGGEALYGNNASRKSIQLAETANSKMNKALGLKNRGAKRQGATVLQRTKMPAVTVEAGFVTNSSDNRKFDSGFGSLIESLADGIEEVFGKSAGASRPGTAAGVPHEKPVGDPYAYLTNGAAELYEFTLAAPDGMPVTLESYYAGDEYAKVSAQGGRVYLVKWSDIRKA